MFSISFTHVCSPSYSRTSVYLHPIDLRRVVHLIPRLRLAYLLALSRVCKSECYIHTTAYPNGHRHKHRHRRRRRHRHRHTYDAGVLARALACVPIKSLYTPYSISTHTHAHTNSFSLSLTHTQTHTLTQNSNTPNLARNHSERWGAGVEYHFQEI